MSREVPGVTKASQAIRVAGAFAELGAQNVVIVQGEQAQRLNTRDTDLPAILIEAPAGSRLECEPLGISIDIAATGLSWTAADAAAAARFENALA